MSLPYENSTAGEKALGEIRKIVQQMGASKFGVADDWETGELRIGFELHGRSVELRASARGYAAAWLKEHPYTGRTRGTKADHERKALEKGEIAVYSILRDWLKGQIVAIECGVLTFEQAFLPHMVTSSGHRVVDLVERHKLLEAPKE